MRGSTTSSRRSIIRSVWRALAACFSLASARRCLMNLSGSVALRLALRTPLAIQARWRRARWPRGWTAGRVLLVGLAGPAAGHRALLEVGVVAAAVDLDPLQASVDLDDRRHRPAEELPVVADHDDRHLGPRHERLEQGQPLGVEVVGRLVEQVHVVPGQQQRRQAGACRLAAGQRRHRQVEVHLETEVAGHHGAAGVEVRGAERGPVLQRAGERVVGSGRAVGQGVRGGVQGVGRGRDAGTALPGARRPSRPAGARPPGPGSPGARAAATPPPRPRRAPGDRPGCAAGWTCRRRWARPAPPRPRARRRGRRP